MLISKAIALANKHVIESKEKELASSSLNDKAKKLLLKAIKEEVFLLDYFYEINKVQSTRLYAFLYHKSIKEAYGIVSSFFRAKENKLIVSILKSDLDLGVLISFKIENGWPFYFRGNTKKILPNYAYHTVIEKLSSDKIHISFKIFKYFLELKEKDY